MLSVGVFVLGACGASSSDQPSSGTGGQSGATSQNTGGTMSGSGGTKGGTGGATSGTGGEGVVREPCIRPIGSYQSDPGPATSSNSAYTCSSAEETLVFIADMPEDQSVPVGAYTCILKQTQYSDDNCDRLEVITCTDGSSLEIDCTSDPDGDVLQCDARSDVGVTVCSNSVTFTRTDCPDWALMEDGSCRQCESDDVCPIGQECFGGACLTPCADSIDCGSGLECTEIGYCEIEPVG